MITASSEATLAELPDSGAAVSLDQSRGQLLPLAAGPVPQFQLIFDADRPATVRAELRIGQRPDDYTCDIVLAATEIELGAGTGQPVKIDFDAELDQPGYAQLSLLACDGVAVHVSDQLLTGTVGLRHKATQEEDAAIGRPWIEFWTPERRPAGRNLALRLDPGAGEPRCQQCQHRLGPAHRRQQRLGRGLRRSGTATGPGLAGDATARPDRAVLRHRFRSPDGVRAVRAPGVGDAVLRQGFPDHRR